MKREKQIKALSTIALVISIISLTIAYALMSSKLTINGYGNIKGKKLNVHFENLTSSKKGEATIEKYPKIKKGSTYIGDFSVTLRKPGDSVTFCYDVVNKSDVDVKMITQVINGIDVNNVDDKINILKSIYVSSDWDADGVVTDEELLKSNKNVPINVEMPSYLNKHSKKNKCMTISFKSDELPIGDIKIKMRIDNIYTQK